MAIDLGDQPVGTPPTTEQQAQMRTALGLGTAATQASTAFATAGQGALAATAVQPATLTAGLATKADLADGISGAERAKLAGIAEGATANASNAQLRDRSTHTGTQAIASVDGLQTALDGKAAVADGITADERAKLAGIAAGATANSTDAALRARASHTGTQAAATIADFDAAVAASPAVSALAALTPVVAVTEYPDPELPGVLYVLFPEG